MNTWLALNASQVTYQIYKPNLFIMTLAEIRNFAKTCNVRFEEHPIVHRGEEYYNPFSKEWITPEYVVGYEIGLNNVSGRSGSGEWQWVWFETYKDKVDDNTDMLFRERYSMNTGTSHKSFREGWKVEKTIARRMGR